VICALAGICSGEPARASYWSPAFRLATIVPFTRTTVPSLLASTLYVSGRRVKKAPDGPVPSWVLRGTVR